MFHMISQVQAEMDDLIAAECLFCGDIMIRNIDKPFIEDADFQRVINEWLWEISFVPHHDFAGIKLL